MGRLNEFDRSFRCYQNQTYPNRELIVVNEGTSDYQQCLADRVQGRDDVRCIFLHGSHTLGALRNISVGAALGDFWIQWDDDDCYMPQRIATQYRGFVENPNALIVCLSDQLHYYHATQQLFWDDWTGLFGERAAIPNTIMARKHGFLYRYPTTGDVSARGEDTCLIGHIYRREPARVVLVKNQGCLYVYCYHGKNVWDVNHHLFVSQRAMSRQRVVEQREKVIVTLEHMQFAKTVNVMGKDGLAFIWNQHA